MITGATIGFYLLAIVAILASLRVITRTNPVHALLNMIVTLLALSGIFFALGAPFAGALEIIVYAGAIMVLFVFVVMMLNLGTQSTLEEESWLTSSAWAVPAGLAFIVGLTLFSLIGMKHGFEGMMPAFIGVEPVTAKMIGAKLFTEYLLLVEIAGFLLLAGLVAAYHLARSSLDDENESHNSELGNTIQPALTNFIDKEPSQPAVLREVQEEKA
ncbi:NADH-quinone oxidoreductase subunit J [Moraxella osloensis]|uniref:NADH-quinone oxidoreductase subunit J n=1 Tax=Faucicola osloensis TaxID=34062 RepID=A0A378QB35_FAUOS|nr:NADH-quinone oxidoreductase subunit J [Moraxella osloensis]AME02044.1 NADH-ubiquinone oxidoreductase [Moraxella osloensis]OBX56502.1 NADH-quinone oxidoreductase subunit J [Moraxella osloensis]QPT42212.1 NADH-quinone oxidoreductase subunit J [Moraxella osloensis]STY97845.1 NADH-quinone oxidoreductase subunit J [Moraxella osloensis]